MGSQNISFEAPKVSTNPPKPRGARWDETMVKLSQVVLGGGASWWWVFRFLGLLLFFSWRGAIFAEYSLRCAKNKSSWYESFWSNYSDLTRPHPKWWFSKGNHLISRKSRLVKYYTSFGSDLGVVTCWRWSWLDAPSLSYPWPIEPRQFNSVGCLDVFTFYVQNPWCHSYIGAKQWSCIQLGWHGKFQIRKSSID